MARSVFERTCHDWECSCYTIGFTENHFQVTDSPAVKQTDQNRVYSSPALDYAERYNRGKAKHFHDHTCHLDKQRTRCVSKIHHDILNLMFELSERRKSAVPFNRSTTALTIADLRRAASRASTTSSESDVTSSSAPVIHVQQLPPLGRPGRISPSYAGRVRGGGPEIISPCDKGEPTYAASSFRKTCHTGKRKGVFNKKSNSDDAKVKGSASKTTQVAKVQISDRHSACCVHEDKSNLTKQWNKTHKTKEMNSGAHNSQQTHTNLLKEKTVVTKPRFREQNKSGMVQNNKPKYFYGFRNTCTSVVKRKFCASPYQERAERERIYNIRRWHVSQTNTGPLDFNKLRRQLVARRSKSFSWQNGKKNPNSVWLYFRVKNFYHYFVYSLIYLSCIYLPLLFVPPAPAPNVVCGGGG